VSDAEAPRKRFFVRFPPGYFQMTEGEQEAAAGEMATEIQRQLGITPKQGPGNEGDTA
jgi:hypothetical protein